MSETARLWIIIGVVILTNLITFVVVWDYWARKHWDLLRSIARNKRTAATEIQQIKIREEVYKNVQLGDLEKDQ